MSKLVTGSITIESLEQVRQAAAVLGWTVYTPLDGVRVKYYEGLGEVCDMTVQPIDEQDKYGHDVGSKYTIGFRRESDGHISMLHDNAMNGAEAFTVESGQQDDTTQRVVGKLKQAIARVRVESLLMHEKASWRVEQRADGAQVMVVRRRN